MSFFWKGGKQAPADFMVTSVNRRGGFDLEAGLDGLCLSQQNSQELIVNFVVFLFFYFLIEAGLDEKFEGRTIGDIYILFVEFETLDVVTVVFDLC